MQAGEKFNCFRSLYHLSIFGQPSCNLLHFFPALLNSYEAEESKEGKPSEQEAFIDAVSVKGGPMEIAFKYIKEKGKISFQVKSLAPRENPTSI